MMFLLLSFLILRVCSIVYCGQVTNVTGDISKYRMLQSAYVAGEWNVGTPVKMSTEVSRIQCAAQCSQNDDCYIAEWFPTRTCKMYHERNLQIGYPITTSVSTVIIGRPLKIVLVYASSWYSFSYATASQACKDLGGRLITSTEMWDAFNAGEMHVGSCGYIDNGSAYYVLQYLIEGLGYQGVNNCYWASSWNAFCSLSGYTGP